MTLATLIGHVTPLATRFFLSLVSLFGTSVTFANSVSASVPCFYLAEHCSLLLSASKHSHSLMPLQTTSNLEKKIFKKLNSEVGRSKRKTVKRLRSHWSQDSDKILDCLHFAIILFENSSEIAIPILTEFLLIWPQPASSILLSNEAQSSKPGTRRVEVHDMSTNF